MEKSRAIELLEHLAWDKDIDRNPYGDALNIAIEALKTQLSCEGTTFALNNQVNLCDSCTYTYPECPSEKDDVIFGNGIGNDNICACNKYQPTVQPVATDTISKTDAVEHLRRVLEATVPNTDYDEGFIDGVEFGISTVSTMPIVQPEKRTKEHTETHACDLISRQAAIDALDCINGVEEVLRSLPPAQPESQWILCSEKMPEEHEWIGTKKFGTTISDEVYVTFENEKGERFCKHMTFQNGELSRYDKFYMDAWYKGSKPIAWMPLPEPYKPTK